MGRLSDWWAQRAHLRVVRSIKRRATPELNLTARPLELAPPRFTFATSQAVIAEVSELCYLGHTAVVRSPAPGTLEITLDGEPLDVGVQLSTAGNLEHASVRRDGELIAHLRETAGKTTMTGRNDMLVCHRQGSILYADATPVGLSASPYWMTAAMTVQLIRELEPIPMLLFAATRAIPIAAS